MNHPALRLSMATMAVGMIPARRSMEIAIEKAGTAGTGWVATRNSNHFGIAGYYAMMALKHRYDRNLPDKCQSTGCTNIFNKQDDGNESDSSCNTGF